MVNVEEILEKYNKERSNLIEIVHDMAKHNIEYNNLDNLKILAENLKTTVADIYGTLTFYGMFTPKRETKYVIRACSSTVCHVKKSEQIQQFLRDMLECDKQGISRDGLFKLEVVECLGLCDIAAAMMVNDRIYGNLDENKIKDIIEELKNENGN